MATIAEDSHSHSQTHNQIKIKNKINNFPQVLPAQPSPQILRPSIREECRQRLSYLHPDHTMAPDRILPVLMEVLEMVEIVELVVMVVMGAPRTQAVLRLWVEAHIAMLYPSIHFNMEGKFQGPPPKWDPLFTQVSLSSNSNMVRHCWLLLNIVLLLLLLR